MIKFLLLLAIVLCGLIIFQLFSFDSAIKPMYITEKTLIQNSKIDANQVKNLINEVNVYNKTIISLCSYNVDVTVRRNGIAHKLHAQMFYEKPLNFRILVKSIISDELDLGSNNQFFWFWIKRMDNTGVYWAKQEDYQKTKLKSPFNPKWVASSLGANEIDLTNSTIDKYNNYLRILNKSTNGSGSSITISTIIDKKSIVGQYVYDKNNIMVAGSEIVEFEYGLPKRLNMFWYEEDCSMSLVFNNMKKNTGIDQRYWQMPMKQPYIDMTKN